MLSQQILTSFALLQLAAATQSAQALTPRQAPTGPCSTGVHVIAAGGGGTDNPFVYGLLGSLAESIVAAIPNSTRVSLPYDKLTTRTNPNAIPDGVATLTQYVNDYNAACPTTKQVLLGYSSGAIITMNGICGGPVTADNNIIATVVYGDQTRQSAQPYNLGSCTAGSGRNPRTPGSCGAFTPNIRSYCNTADVECCSGGDPQEHFVYPTQFDDDATQFVRERFEAAGGSSASEQQVAVSEAEAVSSLLVRTSSSMTAGPAPSTTELASTSTAASVVGTTTIAPSLGTPTSALTAETETTTSLVTPTRAPSAGLPTIAPAFDTLTSASATETQTSTPLETQTSAPLETPSSAPTAQSPASAPLETPTSAPDQPQSPQGMTESMAQILLQEAEKAGYTDGCISMSGAMKQLLLDEAERAGFTEAC